ASGVGLALCNVSIASASVDPPVNPWALLAGGALGPLAFALIFCLLPGFLGRPPLSPNRAPFLAFSPLYAGSAIEAYHRDLDRSWELDTTGMRETLALLTKDRAIPHLLDHHRYQEAADLARKYGRYDDEAKALFALGQFSEAATIARIP